jgi:hypothetical protein
MEELKIAKKAIDNLIMNVEDESLYRLDPLDGIKLNDNIRLECWLIKRQKLFHLNGVVVLHDGKRCVDVNNYLLPAYYLYVKELKDNKYTGRNVCILCGPIRYSVIRAHSIIRLARCHILHVEDVLSDNNIPSPEQFDEFLKSPLKYTARKKMHINGSLVSNRTVIVTGLQEVAE